jgi:hypothetical protein
MILSGATLFRVLDLLSFIPERSPRVDHRTSLRAAVLAPHVAPEVEHALPRREPGAEHLDRDLRPAPAVEALDGDRWMVDEVFDPGSVERRCHHRFLERGSQFVLTCTDKRQAPLDWLLAVGLPLRVFPLVFRQIAARLVFFHSGRAAGCAQSPSSKNEY